MARTLCFHELLLYTGSNVEKGVEKDNNKERWFFHVERVGDDLYTISNERFGGAPWKLEWEADKSGDREAYCSNPDKGVETDSPGRFHWSLEPAPFKF